LQRGQARRQHLCTAHREVAARVAMRHHGLIGDQVLHAGPGIHDPNLPMLMPAGHRWVRGAAPVPAFVPVMAHGWGLADYAALGPAAGDLLVLMRVIELLSGAGFAPPPVGAPHNACTLPSARSSRRWVSRSALDRKYQFPGW
jgi:hypothetical protein